MKMAKLPNGKTLRFPDHTPDEAIDATVRAHLKDHAEKAEGERKAREAEEAKHASVIAGLGKVAATLADHTALLQHLIQQNGQGHQMVIEALNELAKAQRAPRKTRMRARDGRMLEAESYVETPIAH